MVEKNPSIFIELLKERNCLWQIKCKEYENKILRNIAIKTITLCNLVCALWTAFVMAKEFRGRI